MNRSFACVVLLLVTSRAVAEQIPYTGSCSVTYLTLGLMSGVPHGDQRAIGGNYGNSGVITVNTILDTATPRLTYESFTLNVAPIVVEIDDNYTVGLGQTVPIHTTVSLGPISLASRNCRAFSLTPGLSGFYEIEHDKLLLDDSFILNGSYRIAGPTQVVTQAFSLTYSLPSNTFLFPWFKLDGTTYPASLGLKAWKQNPMTYNEPSSGSGHASEFDAVVDGASVAVNIQWLSLRLDSDATLTPTVLDWRGGQNPGPTDWGTAANWNLGTFVPDGRGFRVSFGNSGATSNVTDMISVGRTVGSVTFAATTATMIQSTGGKSLTLDNGSSAATISIAGSHTISAPVVLDSDVDISGTGSLNLSGGISGNQAMNVLSGSLTAKSIQVDTLTIGSGASVTISATAAVAEVPEPSTFVLLGIGSLSLLGLRYWRRPARTPRQTLPDV